MPILDHLMSSTTPAHLSFEPRILVCLASEQIMQNAVPALRLRPQRVVIAASDTEPARRAAEQVTRVLVDYGWPAEAVRIVNRLPDHDLGAISRYARQLADELQREHPGLPIDFNASGGTKVMSFGFLGAFAGLGDAWFCDTRYSLLEHLGNGPVRELPPDMLKLADLLQMQGYRVVTDPTWDPVFARTAASRASLTERLAREAPHLNGFFGYVNRLTREALPQTRTDGCILRPFRAAIVSGRPLFDYNHDLAHAFVRAGLWEWDGDCLFTFADQEAAAYIGGGWLEEWAWLCLAGLEADGVLPDGHWGSNLRIDAGHDEQEQIAVNELDAAVVWRNQLLFLECKTGVQISTEGGSQTILNRLDSLRRHVGGAMGETWLLTARRLQPGTGSAARERARTYRIRLVEPEELIHLRDQISAWMTPVPGSPEAQNYVMERRGR
ncbi:MAG TPA: DUF1887 family CARF protein [Accumulibacter sp.]|nr:DUF1887 family CARF protein [Accumulibacter sp.]HNK01393.1 DUF1887 family CARF protein [Accumulibacter sp.]